MPETEQITVMVADDHPIMRNGLRDALEAEADLEVVALAADGVEAVRAAQEFEPQVIIMDVMMPNQDGVDACREIMDLLPDTRVLMLTASTIEDSVVDAIAAGATGFLQKHAGPEELAGAVRDVAQGRLHIPEQSIRQVFQMIRNRRETTANRPLETLTDREQEVLPLFASGMSYAQIADARGNRTVSVRNAIYRIQEKLGLETKQAVVVWAVRNGLLDNGDPGQAGTTPR